MRYNINVIYKKDEHGYYVFCPQLEGCHSQGDTFEEARINIQEAVELYLETLSKDEITERLSHEVITSSLEIAIAYNYPFSTLRRQSGFFYNMVSRGYVRRVVIESIRKTIRG